MPYSIVGKFVVDDELGIGEVLDVTADGLAVRFGRVKRTVRMPKEAFDQAKLFSTLPAAEKHWQELRRAAVADELGQADPATKEKMEKLSKKLRHFNNSPAAETD